MAPLWELFTGDLVSRWSSVFPEKHDLIVAENEAIFIFY